MNIMSKKKNFIISSFTIEATGMQHAQQQLLLLLPNFYLPEEMKQNSILQERKQVFLIFVIFEIFML